MVKSQIAKDYINTPYYLRLDSASLILENIEELYEIYENKLALAKTIQNENKIQESSNEIEFLATLKIYRLNEIKEIIQK